MLDNFTVLAISCDESLKMLRKQIPIREKLDRIASLENGWHGPEGIALSPSAVSFAEDRSRELLSAGVDQQDCFPGLYGEMRVTGYTSDRYIEITLENNGECILCIEDSKTDEEIFRESIQSENIGKALISILGAPKWNTSEFFRNFIGMSGSNGTKVLPFVTHQTKAAFL